jgi:hypothetical protein
VFMCLCLYACASVLLLVRAHTYESVEEWNKHLQCVRLGATGHRDGGAGDYLSGRHDGLVLLQSTKLLQRAMMPPDRGAGDNPPDSTSWQRHCWGKQ